MIEFLGVMPAGKARVSSDPYGEGVLHGSRVYLT